VFASRSRKLERLPQPDLGRHGFINQRLEGRIAEQAQHFFGFCGARANMAAHELIRVRRQIGG
jgi:hypothetical protein